MTVVNYPDVAVDENGYAIMVHTASHHVQGIAGGAEITLCGVLITYSAWKGTAPGAPRCFHCERLDC